MKHIQESHDLLALIENQSMPLVLIESPLASDNIEGIVRNKKYARLAARDCLRRGESPYASHLIFAQEGLINDNIPVERAIGIHAGLLWGVVAAKTVVYTDLGISSGMRMGIERAKMDGRIIEERKLNHIPSVSPDEITLEKLRIKVEFDIAPELNGLIPLNIDFLIKNERNIMTGFQK